jgi:hypothetical protein
MGRWKETGLAKMKVCELHRAKMERKSKLEIVLGFELGGAWERVKELSRDEWMKERREKKLATLKEENSEQMMKAKSGVNSETRKEMHLAFLKAEKEIDLLDDQWLAQ